MQKSFRSHSGVVENFFRSLSELVHNSLEKSLMSHAGVMQESSEPFQKAFRVIQDSFGMHSEFVQNLFRSHSGVIQNSHSKCIQSIFRIHSELIRNSFRRHSRKHSGAIHESSRCLPGVLQHSIGTRSELARQMDQVRSRTTNSWGYEFI